MDYEKQLEDFYSNINYNPVSAIATSIYQAIVFVAHCANRYDDLSIASKRLLSMSGEISQNQLRSGRNELINKNYISYKKGKNQNVAPKYSVIRLSKDRNSKSVQAEHRAEHIAEYIAEHTAEHRAEHNINKTKLDLFFNYLNNAKADFFEDGQRTINAKEKTVIVMNLKRLELYIDNLEVIGLFTEQSLLQVKIFYWIVKELYFRPCGIYLRNLTNNMLAYKYLKAKQYTNAEENFDIEKIIGYTIRCIENELEERNKNVKNSR